MNILFVSAILPYPLYSGGQVRIYNLLKRLSSEHTIHLCCFIRHPNEEEYVKFLPFCDSVTLVYRGRAWRPSYIARSIFTNLPFLMATYTNETMKKTLEQMILGNKFDLIHIEPGYVWPSIPETNVPIVVGEHNIEHTIYQGFIDKISIIGVKNYMSYDVQKLVHWEKRVWSSARRIIAVSKPDAEVISSVVRTPVSVVPNGVDESTFPFFPKNISTTALKCLFVGNFRWLQNKDAFQYLLDELWPRIIQEFPKAQLKVVGKEFPNSFRKRLPDSVSVADYVEEISLELKEHDVLLAPIRIGGGTKYKILEGMASGIPVITTLKGTEGLPLEDKKNCYVSKDTEDWITNLSLIIGNRNLNNKIIHSARALIEKKFTWTIIAKEMDQAWKQSV